MFNCIHCGELPIIKKGIANKKNWYVKCDKCNIRTRYRKTPQKAIKEWNKYRDSLWQKERKNKK